MEGTWGEQAQAEGGTEVRKVGGWKRKKWGEREGSWLKMKIPKEFVDILLCCQESLN